MRLAAFCLIAALAAAAQAQPTLEEVIRANTYTLEVRDGRLAGPGMDFLVEATQNAQFVGLAETHNVAQTPQFATMLFRRLHELHGFDHLALEQGPVIMELLGTAARDGGTEAMFEMARRFPSSLHFHTDQELQMIADVSRIPGAGPRVVGLDRSTDTAHLFAEMTASEAGVVHGAAIATAADELTSALGDDPGAAEYRRALEIAGALATEIAPPAGSRVAELLQHLHDTTRNRLLYEEASKENDSGYRHNLEREQIMKRHFMKHYRAAQAAGDSEPRFIFKFGQWHMLRGRLWGNYFTLGTLLTELATSNGREAFIINIQPINRPGRFWSLTDYPDWSAIASAGNPDKWVLVDVRPLRGFLHNGAIKSPSEDFELDVFGADAFLLIGGASRGTETWRSSTD